MEFADIQFFPRNAPLNHLYVQFIVLIIQINSYTTKIIMLQKINTMIQKN